MKIVVAPDKFKGSLSAQEVCNAIEEGIHKFNASIEVIKHPLADGGEGTLNILQNYFTLKTVSVIVQNPIFNKIEANYMISSNTAYIEMCNASGLQLLKKHEQNCCFTSTFGTGELIADALKKGFKNIVLFIGGSATNDAGIGMASALGYEFYNAKNKLIKPIGINLINIDKIKNTNLLFDLSAINFTVVCDVKNVLFGKKGAAYMYGIQKGASFKDLEVLDNGLKNISEKINSFLNVDISKIEGGGAAGGLGAGAVAFLNAKLKPGIEFVLEQTNFKSQLQKGIDFIITGEGSTDKQTLEGKVVKGISDVCNNKKIPFSIITGVIKDKEFLQEKLNPKIISSIMELGVTVEDAMQNAYNYVSSLSFEQIKSIKKANV